MANNFASFRRDGGRFKGGPVVGGPGWFPENAFRIPEAIFQRWWEKGVNYSAPYGRGVLLLMGEQRVTLRPAYLEETNILLVPWTSSFCFRSHAFGRRLLWIRERERERDSRGGRVGFLAGWVIELFYLLNKGIDFVGIKFFRLIDDDRSMSRCVL